MRRTRDPAGQATGGALEVSDCASVLPEHSPCSLDPQVIRVELGQRRRRYCCSHLGDAEAVSAGWLLRGEGFCDDALPESLPDGGGTR